MESGAKNMDLSFPKEAYQNLGSESTCLRHEPCPSCGSKDNLARYDDGHAFCFTNGCNHYEHGNNISTSKPKNKTQKNRGAFTPIGGEFKENLHLAKEEAKEGKNEDAVNRLSYLFSQDEYTAELNARPYLGMTTKTKRKIRDILKKAFEGKV